MRSVSNEAVAYALSCIRREDLKLKPKQESIGSSVQRHRRDVFICVDIYFPFVVNLFVDGEYGMLTIQPPVVPLRAY